MPSRPLTRTFSTPRPSSGLASDGHNTPVPCTYASPADVAAYLAAMHKRGRPDADKSVVYLATSTHMREQLRGNGRHALVRAVAPCRIGDFAELAAARRSAERNAGQQGSVADVLMGLIVPLGTAGIVGPDVLREVVAAHTRGLPVLIWETDRRAPHLVPFLDCHLELIEYADERPRWTEGVIRLPLRVLDRPTLLASLQAMGARAGGQ